MSIKALEYNMRMLYRKNTEFSANDFKALTVHKKVILPLQLPKELENNWLCMTSTPQNDKAGKIAEIPVGAIVDDNGYVIIKPEHTVSITSVQCPFPKRMLPNREVVLKAISQARQLLNPELPVTCSYPTSWEVNNPIPRVDTVNLLAARMEFFGLTNEDGYVISESAARKCISFHKAVDKFVLPKGFKLAVDAIDAHNRFLLENFEDIMKSNLSFINRGGIAVISKDEEGKAIALNEGAQRDFISHVGIADDTKKAIISKHRGIVIDIERKEVDETSEMIIVTTLCRNVLEIGSKITDRNSHKGTISAILPDHQMPRVRIPDSTLVRPLDIICPTWIAKRCTPSREMEEIASCNYIKTTHRYISSYEDSLDSIKEKFGSNISSLVFNIHNDDYPILTSYVPIGLVAFAVLDHIPSKKIRYAHKINTNYAGRTVRGIKNYNFTDGLYAIIENNAMDLLKEIQSYALDNNENMSIMNQSLETFGFNLTGGHIHIQNEGIFKSEFHNYTSLCVSKGMNKSEEATTEDTIFDKKFEQNKIAIKLPAGIPLTHNELAKTLGCNSTVQSKIWTYLKSNIALKKMKNLNIPLDHVYNTGKEDKYLIVSDEMLYTYVDYTGTRYPNKFMEKVNNLIQLLNNTVTMLKMPIRNEELDNQLIRCNIKFNEIVDILAHRTVTKSGIIRETLSPRLPFTGYLVAANASNIPFNTVMIPLRMITSFANEERFRKAYDISEDWDSEYLINHFNSNKFRALVMRQPCHRRNEISSYIIKVWKNSSIGINSAAIKVKSGDHDGDALFAYLPLSKESQNDLMKLKAEDMISVVGEEKGLIGFETKTIQELQETFRINTGMAEHIDKDNEHFERYHQYAKPIPDEEYRRLQANAANDFLYIKLGTANAGGIGNLVRHIMYDKLGVKGITLANNIYHNLAQAALDTKAGTDNAFKLDSLLSYFRSFKAPNKPKLLTYLSCFLQDAEKNAMLSILYDDKGNWTGGLSVLGAKDVPFSRILYRGGIGYLYRASANPDESSVATLLASI
jgi:hypothetical protein